MADCKARMQFMNTCIDNLTLNEALHEIEKMVERKRTAYVVTPNVDHIVQLETDKELQEVYANADLILADGKPLIWISKLYKTPIKEKISGSDLFPEVCKLAAEKGYSMFFLGAAEGVAAKAARNLQKRYPGLRVVGTYSPPMNFERDKEKSAEANRIVKEAGPDILIVGLGCPKQEKYIYRYRNELEVPLALGLGASLDFEAGNIKRAPKWMRDHGLEWLFRITQDPKRLFKRYVIQDSKIWKLLLKYRPKKR